MPKAKQVMTSKVVTIGPEATLAEAIQVLLDRKISGMPVVDASGRLVGIISEKDMLNFRRVPILEDGKVVGIVSRRDIIRAALLGK